MHFSTASSLEPQPLKRMRPTFHLLVGFALCGQESSRVEAQDSAAAQPGTLSVFLDCEGGCDTQYIRTEIAWVNWVRDRTAADVHVLITSQDAGGGGEQFTVAFIGQRALAGRGDTLTYTTNATTTDDEERQGLTRTLALGLVQFVARTPGAQSLTTQGLTTQGLTTQGLTTQDLTTQDLRTQGLTTQGLTTQDLRTQGLTTLLGVATRSALFQVWRFQALRFRALRF